MPRTEDSQLHFHADAWTLYIPATFILLCIVWWRCLPISPGNALAALAIAAAVLLARADTGSRTERLVWGLIALALFIAEARVAYLDHLDIQSFLVCHIGNDHVATVDLHGSREVRSAGMHIIDDFDLTALKRSHTDTAEAWFAAYQHLPVGNFAPGTTRRFCVRSLARHGQVVHYRVQFSATNGYWWEDLQARMVGGRPVQALRVARYRNARPQVLFESADREYPRDQAGKIDWRWAAKEP